MADVIIKDVPTGAEADVKKMAMVAIERFLRERDVKVEDAVQTKYESDIDTILDANGLDKKYTVKEVTDGLADISESS